jgi:hypothetical protein
MSKFEVIVAVALNEKGAPSQYEQYFRPFASDISAYPLTRCARRKLPSTASWADLQAALTSLSKTTFAESRGRPDGYTVEGGKWLYQRVDSSVVHWNQHQGLANWDDYRAMRRKMDKENWQRVMIIHELVCEESRAKAREEARLKMRSEMKPQKSAATQKAIEIEDEEEDSVHSGTIDGWRVAEWEDCAEVACLGLPNL